MLFITHNGPTTFFKTYNEVEAGKPNGIPWYLTAELSWMLLELNKFWKNA